MCGEIFWKRITIFCLAFGLGFFVTNVFVPKKLPTQNVLSPVTNRENCVQVDGFFRHNLLAEKEQTDTLKDETAKEFEIQNSKTEPQLHVPERDKSEYKTLLHKEKCYDSDVRK